MTQYVSFTPSAIQPFAFNATLDGEQHLVTVTWSLFGRRWYFNVFALDGTVVVTNYPLSGSPPSTNINLIAAWFKQSVMVYRPELAQIIIDPPAPASFTPPA